MTPLEKFLLGITVPSGAYVCIVLGYVALAYIAVIVFVVGVLYRVIRWAVTPKGPGGLYWGLYRLTLYPNVHSFWKAAGWIFVRMFTFYTLLKENFGYVSGGFWFGLILFHYSIWATLLFHGNIIAYALNMYFHVPLAVKYWLGIGAGVLAYAGLIYLAIRRAYVQARTKVKINYFDDWLLILQLLIIMGFGLAAKCTAYPSSFTEEAIRSYVYSTYSSGPLAPIKGELVHLVKEYGSVMFILIGEWFKGLLTGNINLAVKAMYCVAVYHPLELVHVFFAEWFLIYIPWSKMIHMFMMPFNPALYGKFESKEPALQVAIDIVEGRR